MLKRVVFNRICTLFYSVLFRLQLLTLLFVLRLRCEAPPKSKACFASVVHDFSFCSRFCSCERPPLTRIASQPVLLALYFYEETISCSYAKQVVKYKQPSVAYVSQCFFAQTRFSKVLRTLDAIRKICSACAFVVQRTSTSTTSFAIANKSLDFWDLSSAGRAHALHA